jgi:hypothetical protein
MVGLDRFGASVTTKLRIWLISAFFGLALALVGFIVIMGMFTGEYWCQDRHPWWGPPESGTDAECAGYVHERSHPSSP